MFAALFRRRLTPGRDYLPVIDGLRAASIIGVVLYHLSVYVVAKMMDGATLGPADDRVRVLLNSASHGVEIFFVISGFLLVLPFARWRLGLAAAPPLRPYLLRRLTRLEPPYLAALLLYFIGKTALFGAAWAAENGGALGASAFYQFGLLFGGPNPVSAVAWSLEVEVVAYLLIPSAAAVFLIRDPRRRRAVLLAWMIVPPLLRLGIPAEVTARFGSSLPWYVEFFAAGFLLADLHLTVWRDGAEPSGWWDLASLAGWGLLMVNLHDRDPDWATPMIVLLLMAGALRGRWSRRFFSAPLLTAIGGMSYTIYLLHSLGISVAGRFALGAPWGTTYHERLAQGAVFTLPAIAVVSLLFYLMLERPCMDPEWPRKLWRRLRS